MDEQRLERALRQGPPLTTPYMARSLSLEEVIAVRRSVITRRVPLLLVALGLLLTAAVAALAIAGYLRPSSLGPLAFIRGDALYVLPDDGTPERQILPGVPDGNGGWCPAQQYLVTCGFMSVAGWSPADGLVLRVGTDQDSSGLFGGLDLYVVHADGTGLRLLHHESGNAMTVELSPDGRHIVLTVGQPRETGRHMVVVDVDDGKTISLPDGYGPSWSPDNKLIAYESGAFDDVWVVNVVNVDGTQARVVAPGTGPMFRAGILAWSPDSKGVAVTNPLFGGVDIVAIDGSREPQHLIPGVETMGPWAWSPDGRHIAAVVDGTRIVGGSRIVLMAADGSDPIEIARGDDYDGLSWSRDGRWLVWSALLDPTPQIVAYDTVDGSVRMLTTVRSGFVLGPQ